MTTEILTLGGICPMRVLLDNLVWIASDQLRSERLGEG